MLMSKSAYAKHRGVSRQTVYDWIERGEIVMSGSKIDVEATERQRNAGASAPVNGGDTGYSSERTLEMTWKELLEAVKAHDGKVPAPEGEAEIEQRVVTAAAELGWDGGLLEDGGVWLDDGDAEYYFQRYDFTQNAELAISLLRREICYTACEQPEDVDCWSEAGIRALAEWDKPPR